VEKDAIDPGERNLRSSRCTMHSHGLAVAVLVYLTSMLPKTSYGTGINQCRIRVGSCNFFAVTVVVVLLLSLLYSCPRFLYRYVQVYALKYNNDNRSRSPDLLLVAVL
jgi:hypothetical protein